MEVVEMYCDLLLTRFGLIEQMKTLDDGIAEAISSIIWVTPRLQSDVAELKVVSDQLAIKYGKPYANGCKENAVETVSEKLVRKLNVQAPPKLTVEKYLIEIAKYYNIEYEPDPQVMQADETYAADALLELGPAPPLPNKADLAAAGALPPPGPGAAAAAGGPPPMQPQQQPYVPFSYPTPSSGAAAMPPYPYPPASGTQPPLPGGTGGASAASASSDLLSFNDENGPPPAYFPPDMGQQQRPHAPAAKAPSTALVEDNNAAKPAASSSSTNNLDIPELPEIPSGTPTHTANNFDDDDDDVKKGNNDEEDIDFDDLTKRFEALKKKK